ncbi:lycopene cyclase domain-containing protein [Leifsonia sp. NPDC058292]|uniref:lycopene cyclase domain-containing protein n=1 Tax=Leifsonia sp. NPDC058292 TaxID=3346428 RepID=UPI0036DD14E8
MTYLVLSLVFLVVAAAVLGVALWRAPDARRLVGRWWPSVLIAAVVIIVLTAVFDNLMIGSGLIRYSDDRVSGLRIGAVPIEDFAYPIAALLLLPALWIRFRRKEAR